MARRRESENFVKACVKALDTIEKMEKEKPIKLKEDLDEMAKSVIAKWYATYDPQKYNRTRSLYHSYKFFQDGIDIEMDFDSSYLSDFNHHQDNDIIYNNIFVGGYHGGSIGTDSNGDTATVPRWRKPFREYTSWGKEAPKSFSPHDEIEKQAKKMMRDYDREWASDLRTKVLNPVQRSLGGLKRK